MKRNDIILLLAVALYSYLFYAQAAGLNFLLFNIAVIAGILTISPECIRSLHWKVSALGSLVSAIGILLYGNDLSITANVISLSALSAFTLAGKSSLLTGLFHSAYSYLSSIPYMVIDTRRRVEDRPDGESVIKRTFVTFGIIAIVSIFYLLYRSANPVFEAYTAKLNFEFFDWGRFWFTMGGLVLLYGFLNPKAFAELLELDSRTGNHLNEATLVQDKFTNYFSIEQENKTGIALLSFLNLLLLVVNVLDINVLFIQSELPEGLSPAQMVHQGIGTLIFSIILAIIIILFYFRGRLNYFQESRPLIVLSLVWVVQNILMIFLNVQRNHLYIEEFGLTYKRIGVYVYLLLALIGLVFTAVKILGKRNNVYLFRANSWAFYAVLIASTLIGWNSLIIDYNISRTRETGKTLDARYLLSLGYESYAAIIKLENKYLPPDWEVVEYIYDPQDQTTDTTGKPKPVKIVKVNRYKKQAGESADDFLYEMLAYDWRSWSLKRRKTYTELRKIFRQKDLKRIITGSSVKASCNPRRSYVLVQNLIDSPAPKGYLLGCERDKYDRTFGVQAESPVWTRQSPKI